MSQHTREELSFRHQVWPLLCALRLIGLCPLHTSSGQPTFRAVSLVSAYSCVLNVAGFALGYLVVNKNSFRVVPSEDFNDRLYMYLNLTFLFIFVLAPSVSWPSSYQQPGYLAAWHHFQEEFVLVTGQPLRLGLRPVTRRVLGAMCVMIIVSVTTQIVVRAGPLPEVVLSTMCVSLEILSVGICVLCCRGLTVASRAVFQHLQVAVNSSEDASAMNECRLLWLSLSRLASLTGDALCWQIGYTSVFSFIFITMSSYGLVNAVRLGHTMRMVELGAILLSNMSVLFALCYGGELVHTVTTADFKRELSAVSQRQTGGQLWKEVSSFLRTMSMFPPVPSLGGFAVLNMNLFSSMMSTVITYLIVLTQFELGLRPTQSV